MEILENVNLKEYNTFMLPSIARYFVEINNVDDILELLNSDIYKNIPKKYIL
jgi:UDP-N-acetylenolpyruvoylglucosamine reductase